MVLRDPWRTPALAASLLLAAVSDSRSSGHLPFDEDYFFLNPGFTIAKQGPGLELSAGRAHGAVLIGALSRYEPMRNTAQLGLEAGLALLQFEVGSDISARGTQAFLAPDLCLPLPLSSRHWVVINGFYRVYPSRASANSLGLSVKIPLLPGPA